MRGILLFLLAITFVALPGTAHPQPVQRCIGADGRAVYTDRRCEDIGAVERLPPVAASAAGARQVRGGCPRLLSQLVGEIGGAIQARDVNRLSAVYDWRGVPAASATQLFNRLEAMVGRPLVDIAPVYRESTPAAAFDPVPGTADPGQPPPPEATPSGPASWMPSWSPAPAAGTAAATDPPDQVPAPAPSRPYPVALRIEQTLAGSATPVRTVFGLRRAYGCFWIAL